jgi:polyisoprenoid-binding protein YceI
MRYDANIYPANLGHQYHQSRKEHHMTILRECFPALGNYRPDSLYPPGRNSWVHLDKAWAARLGVPRDRGTYRIRRLELFRLLSEIDQVLPPGKWTIDPAHTSVGFVARHMMISKVRGRFKEVAGTINVGRAPEESLVDIVIGAASIDTGQPIRDNHLKSPDFLDVSKHPHLRFRSTKVEQSDEKSFKLTGDLTIRGVTRPVTLDLDYLGTAKDPKGNCRAAFEAKAQINREEFGLTWNQPLETGGVLIGKEVGLEIEAQAVVEDLAPAA